MSDSDLNEIDLKLVKSFLQFNNLYRFSKSHDPDDKCGKACNHYGLKHSEFNLMFCIRSSSKSSSDGATSSELCARLNVKPPTINPLLSNLEKLGLIERRTDLNDRRFVRIALTPDGEKFTAEHETFFLKRVHGLAQYLGTEKCNELVELMNDIYTYVKNQNK